MFIFDADAHISSERRGIRVTAEEMLSAMDASGVSGGLVWLHPGQTKDEYCDYDAQDRYVFESAARYPDRLLPVGWVNPLFGDEGKVMDSIRMQHEEFGARFIKFNGAQNFYDITSPGVIRRAMNEVVARGISLAFHCGDDGVTNPDKVGEIAARYPDTKILLVHMGQTRNEGAIACAEAHANVTLIGSGMEDFSWVHAAVKRLGSKRVMYGSDAPFRDMKDILRIYDECVLPGLTEEEQQDLMGGNLLRLFGRN